jgi:hypothetical protein
MALDHNLGASEGEFFPSHSLNITRNKRWHVPFHSVDGHVVKVCFTWGGVIMIETDPIHHHTMLFTALLFPLFARAAVIPELISQDGTVSLADDYKVPVRSLCFICKSRAHFNQITLGVMSR